MLSENFFSHQLKAISPAIRLTKKLTADLCLACSIQRKLDDDPKGTPNINVNQQGPNRNQITITTNSGWE
jgi:hypothetical protein